MSEELMAMKTARQSAVSIKLNPRGKENVALVTSPENTEGSMQIAAIREKSTYARENPLRSRGETQPIIGRVQEPIMGTNTAANKRFCMFI
jgi:hypothetical protein